MRTTQGQVAFGHNVQTILPYLHNMGKKIQKDTVGRDFSMRVERTYSRVQTLVNEFSVNCFNFRIIPAKLSRSVKQHPSNSAHLMRRFVRGISIYGYLKFEI
jgi:hypothetical protein